jgi:hypothetical protein
METTSKMVATAAILDALHAALVMESNFPLAE